ncbi:hypothetical protein AWB81_01049 [Caballeronia arationis]|jgi:hypothetical protein|uniref:Uncharacterized protein n=1 Tax=Caballeronia arationis TaxID=1777142 RepID=A0A7Z7N2B7_9BURK|nr:hypothetical protein [Caballeronia arationis]SAK52764.1 hypothetical protein AWB81_01049 [Caballeronia arationis]SOE65447.1 hypothetical protein SAMN05446927_2904 [Caballeronia arationis]
MIVLYFSVLLAGASLVHTLMNRRERLQPARVERRSDAYRER